MKKTLIIMMVCIMCTQMLAGCSAPENEGKQAFYVTTEPLTYFGGGGSIRKTGKVVALSEITVTAQAGGRVQSIVSNIGDKVSQGELVVQLKDPYNALGTALARAQAGLQSAIASSESTMVGLERAQKESELGLKRSQTSLGVTQEDVEQQLKLTQAQRDNAVVGETGSAAGLQLQTLESQIAKAQLDYETKLTADDQLLINFTNSAKTILNDTKSLIRDVMDDTDKIIGATQERKNANAVAGIDIYIGAKDFSQKQSAQNQYSQLQAYKDKLFEITINSGSVTELAGQLSVIQDVLNGISDYLVVVKDVIKNSVSAVQLPQAQIDGRTAGMGGLQAKSQGQSASITAQKNAITSYLATYKQGQESIAKSIDLLKQQRDITEKNLRLGGETADIGLDRTKIQTTNALTQAELGLESAKLGSDSAIKTTNATSKTLQAAVRQAEIGVMDVQNQIAKLTVVAPVKGTITDVYVDPGQDVAPGNPLFRLVSQGQQQVELSLTRQEVDALSVGETVTIKTSEGEIEGTVADVAIAANQSLNYKAIITLNQPMKRIGEIVSLELPVVSEKILLPLNIVTITSQSAGRIYVWKGTGAVAQDVTLGKAVGENVEILTPLSPGYEIITSDVSNFDPLKFYYSRGTGTELNK